MALTVKSFVFNLFGENTYIVYDLPSRQAMVVDPGMSNEDEQQTLLSYISKNELELKYIVNTHLHLDHIFGAAGLEQHFGITPMAHMADFPLGKNISGQAEMFHLRGNWHSPTSFEAIDEHRVLKLGNEDIKILHVPGHSPGSVVLYAPQSGFILSGDVLFQGSIGRTDLPGGSHTMLIKGIESKLLSLPEATVVYPGHGPYTTIEREKLTNPYI